MGRPKGSKNKPKVSLPDALPVVIDILPKPAVAKKKKAVKEELPKDKPLHIVIQFMEYVYERMDGIEMEFYRRLAKRNDRPVKYMIAKAIVDFFRISDQQLDLNQLLDSKKHE